MVLAGPGPMHDSEPASCSFSVLAEREGFEPSIELPLYTLSKRAPSTTRPSLRFEGRGVAFWEAGEFFLRIACTNAPPLYRYGK